MRRQDHIDGIEGAILRTYNRFPVVFERGEGVYLYDTDGEEYLDFAAGIAVCALGYAKREYTDALKGQIDKLIHTSNLFYNVPVLCAARKVLRASGMDRVFFTNSGAEAIEGALKAAKKYAFTRDGRAGHEVIAMRNSFHGRTLGALSVTETRKYREPFEPLIPGIRFADFNDPESVEKAVTGRTCAVILEPVQGEGGVCPADPAFLQSVRDICDERDILLILDEIQCGMGRTGEMFAWQRYGVRPDVMTLAKALGGGVPVGAFVTTRRVADRSLAPGDHGTTYGGNPLAAAAVSAVFDLFEKEGILEHVNEIAPYLRQKLEEMRDAYDFITDLRGMGLMWGLEMDIPAAEVAAKALSQGLVVITAGSHVLRIVPPLVIERRHVDEMAGKLHAVLRTFHP